MLPTTFPIAPQQKPLTTQVGGSSDSSEVARVKKYIRMYANIQYTVRTAHVQGAPLAASSVTDSAIRQEQKTRLTRVRTPLPHLTWELSYDMTSEPAFFDLSKTCYNLKI